MRTPAFLFRKYYVYWQFYLQGLSVLKQSRPCTLKSFLKQR